MQTFYRARGARPRRTPSSGRTPTFGPDFFKVRLPVVCIVVLSSFVVLVVDSTGMGVMSFFFKWIAASTAIILIAVMMQNYPWTTLVGLFVLVLASADEDASNLPLIALFLQGPVLIYLFHVRSRRGSVVLGGSILLLLASEISGYIYFTHVSSAAEGLEPKAFVVGTAALTFCHYVLALVAVAIDRILLDRTSDIAAPHGS